MFVKFQVTTIRAITQELDGFATDTPRRSHIKRGNNRPLADEITYALKLAMRGELWRAVARTLRQLNSTDKVVQIVIHSDDLNITPADLRSCVG